MQNNQEDNVSNVSDNCVECGEMMSWNCCSDASNSGYITACSPDCPRMSQANPSTNMDLKPEDIIEFKFECIECNKKK